MRVSVEKVIVLVLFTAGLLNPVMATPYMDWGSEYDGSSPNTVALYHFSQDDLYTNSAKAYAAVIPDQTDRDWDAYYAPASATCSFGAGGKFGWGLHKPGGSDITAKCSTHAGSTIFPSGGDPSLSVECWVKFNDTSARQFLVSKGKAWSSTGGYDLWYDNGVLKWALGDGTASRQTTASWTPTTGVWYHIAGTWNAATDTAKLFVNGREAVAKSFAGVAIVDDLTATLALGGRSVSNYAELDGIIDEVRISSVAYEFSESVGHPRLFFSATDHAELSARRFTTHTDEWAQLIARCNNLQGSTPTTTPRTYSGSLLDYEEKLVALAVAQYIDPTGPYETTSTNWFWTIMDWTEWGDGYWSWPDYGPRGNLETGEILKALAVWYDLNYDNLTPAERADISSRLADYADRFRNSYPRFWSDMNGELTGNHCWNAFCSLGAVLYASDDISFDRWADWTGLLDGHYSTITGLMNNEMSDGVSGEGATYWTYGIEKILHWFEMRRVAGDEAFDNVAWFENTGRYGLYMTLPGGTDNFGGNAKFADANPDYWGNPYNELSLLAKATRDPIAQWMATQLDHSGSTKKNAYRYLFYDAALPAADPAAELNNWHFFGKYGFFLWRTSWADDAAHFSMRSGQHSHGHDKCDDGQFMIHRAGIPYITNLGYAVPRYTRDSNVLLVDGTGQYSDGEDWGTIFNATWPSNQSSWGQTLHVLANQRYGTQGDFFNVLVDPTQMYTNAVLNQWHREVIGLGGDLYLLRDTVAAGATADFELLLHACVTDKGTGNTYDEDTYRTSNPWTVLSGGKWKIDARNDTPQPPNMLVQDLSIASWSSAIEDTYYDKKGSPGTRLGSKLKRSFTGSAGSSLVSFGFDDLMVGWTQTPWADSAAEGAHVTSGGSAVVDVLWPVDEISCANSDDWSVTGKMAGRRYAQLADDPDACYFGREVMLAVDDGLTLISASAPVSLHARLEQTPGGLVPNRITYLAASSATLTVYCPHEPKTVLLDDVDTAFSWTAGQLTLSVPASEGSAIDLVDPDYLAWRNLHFTPAEIESGLAGLDQDPDSDSATNWEEYVADTDPRNGASSFTAAIAPASGDWEISFATSSNRSYGVEYKTNLLAGAWTALTNGVSGTGGVMTLSGSSDHWACFYRATVVVP